MKPCKACNLPIPSGAGSCPSCGQSTGGFWRNLFGSGKAPAAPPAPTDTRPFQLVVEETFTIPGRGTVLTGKIQSGVIRVGDRVRFSTVLEEGKTCQVSGIEIYRKIAEFAQAGDQVGLLVKDAGPVPRGGIVTKVS